MIISRPSSRKFRNLCIAAMLAMAAGHASSAQLVLPANPVFVSTAVNPNVMMIVDNSGSMDNIIWDEGFDPTVTYPDYNVNSCHFNDHDRRCYASNNGNVILYPTNPPAGFNCNTAYAASCNNFHTGGGFGPEQGACPANYRQGRLNGTGALRCLRLPNPVAGGFTRYSGNYLNYLFHTKVADNGQADLRTSIPNEVRITVAKTVAANLVTANPDVRFGIASYNPPSYDGDGNLVSGAPGGRINANCGAPQATLLTQINGLSASTNTPLSETFYETTRYFRGLSRFNGTGSGNYTSPIQYRCQKNFVLAVTDGFPTYDGGFPTNDPADVADTTRSLPNWDGLAPATTEAQRPNFPQYSDGYNGNDDPGEGASLYLDDLAQFAYDVDIKTTGNDLAGVSYQDPEFSVQNIITYAVGFAVSNQMLIDTAERGQGLYRTASNSAQLTAALQDALTDIAARNASFSSAALNSTSLNAGSRLFQAGFNSANWTGTLKSFPISTSTATCGGLGRLCPQEWEASAAMPVPGSRVILTQHGQTKNGIPFRWGNLHPLTQQAQLNLNPNASPIVADALGEQRLNYIRGDRSLESSTGFRVRGSTLGDIVNSDPFFVGAPNSALPFTGYSGFRSTYKNRQQMVYVGANDGMLHGFRVSDGKEVLAYIPSPLFGTNTKPKLAQLTAQPYTHVFGVDGSPTVGDIETSPGVWASYLVGGLRYGGQGIYALDVTNPANFSEANASSIVKWEFTDADDPDMGYSFSQPSIVKMKNGKWAAIVGNGYNSREADGSVSADGKSTLFIIFMDGPGGDKTWQEGTEYIKFKVGSNNDQGLATPSAVDLDGDSLVDYIYAGDLNGDMWQFNVNSADPDEWVVGYGGSTGNPRTGGAPLFSAGANQPITAQPEVGLNLLTPDPDDLVVYFGTGRFIQVGDNTRVGQDTQSFYGIFANPISVAGVPPTETTSSPAPAIAELLEQTVIQEVTVASGQKGRLTSQNVLDLSTHKGWYLDLYNTNNGTVNDASAATGLNLGERQISKPILRSGRIVFTTLVPSDDACNPDGTGWLMEIDARDGGRPRKPALDVTDNLLVDENDRYDVDGDGDIDEDDWTVSGLKSDDGMLSTPAVLSLTPSQEAKYSVQSDGTTAVFGEAASGRVGRLTWREIAP